MCFGVRDAIALALKESQAGPITILGDLVHNDTVLDELRHRGVEIQTDIRNVATTTVMIRMRAMCIGISLWVGTMPPD